MVYQLLYTVKGLILSVSCDSHTEVLTCFFLSNVMLLQQSYYSPHLCLSFIITPQQELSHCPNCFPMSLWSWSRLCCVSQPLDCQYKYIPLHTLQYVQSSRTLQLKKCVAQLLFHMMCYVYYVKAPHYMNTSHNLTKQTNQLLLMTTTVTILTWTGRSVSMNKSSLIQ